MPVTIIAKDKRQRTKIATLELDAAISVVYSRTADVTDHPVERGSNVSDHVRPKPVEIKIEGMLTNTPIGVGITVDPFSTITPTSTDRSSKAFTELHRLFEAGETLKIVSELFSFENMVIQSLDIPRDSKSGDAFFFTCNLKQIRMVKGERVTVSIPRASTKASQGAKPKNETPEKPASLAKKVVKVFTSVIK